MTGWEMAEEGKVFSLGVRLIRTVEEGKDRGALRSKSCRVEAQLADN